MKFLRIGAVASLVVALAACAGPRDFVRPGSTWDQTRAELDSCFDLAQDQVKHGNLGGAVAGGAVANLGAGAIRGVAKSKAKNRMTIACMRDRGFVGTTVSSEERRIVRGPETPERQSLIEIIYARGDSDE